jgi:hypothetical protein
MVETGFPVIGEGDQKCLSHDAQYFGCLVEMGCGDAPTAFCMGDETYISGDTCGAPGWEMCDLPDYPHCQ